MNVEKKDVQFTPKDMSLTPQQAADSMIDLSIPINNACKHCEGTLHMPSWKYCDRPKCIRERKKKKKVDRERRRKELRTN